VIEPGHVAQSRPAPRRFTPEGGALSTARTGSRSSRSRRWTCSASRWLAILLFNVGLAHAAATQGALLVSTDSLFTVALATVLLRKRLNRRLGLALAAGFAGSVLCRCKAAAA